jgi:hypothetical protein
MSATRGRPDVAGDEAMAFIFLRVFDLPWPAVSTLASSNLALLKQRAEPLRLAWSGVSREA